MAVFEFVSADISFEIVHNRIITVNPSTKDSLSDDDESYAGHSGPLYILLLTNDLNQVNVFTKLFPDYKSFSEQKLGSKYILYASK